MTCAISIRACGPADIPVIGALAIALDREEGVPDSPRGGAIHWHAQLFGPHVRISVLLAEYDGAIAGLLIYGEETPPGWIFSLLKIHDLYVLPDLRRRGVATKLLEHIAAHALTRQIPLMHLNVRSENSAREFYRRSGFEHMNQCLTYLIAPPALQRLAGLAESPGPAQQIISAA
jgi:ribosomal protein S18 acetylase RimI-like enzyme